MLFSPTILLVEDDPGVTRLLTSFLPKENLEVVAVGSAEEAMNELLRRDFDLILADHRLPGMNGLQLLEKVKGIAPDLDVLMMTGHPSHEDMLAALELGVLDYVVKPFPSTNALVKKIWRGLERRKVRLENTRLLEYLQQANAQIEGMNRSLEQRVADRTKQLEEANARLEQLTLVDDVTGLYNQRFLYQRLEHEIARAERYKLPIATIMMDVDNFKRVNDNHDHLFGSRVLKRVGDILRACVRSTDYVVRYGGDEFTLVLTHAEVENAPMVAERIREKIEETDVGDEDDKYNVTASLGVAGWHPGCGLDPRGLLERADRALYKAKKAGRNQVAVDDELIPEGPYDFARAWGT